MSEEDITLGSIYRHLKKIDNFWYQEVQRMKEHNADLIKENKRLKKSNSLLIDTIKELST